VRSKSGVPMSTPKVNGVTKSRCQAHSSSPQTMFGLPKARMRRRIQRKPSETAVPAGVVQPKATPSGPCRRATSRIFVAVQSRASAQLIRSQPASGSDFGRVRRIG